MADNNILRKADELKAHLSTLRPLPEEALAKIREAMEIEYTYESNRIEGNTLTLQETALVINEGVTISGKSMREHLEAINHNEAIAFIKEIAQGTETVSERIILQIHALILRSINRENAGRYRTVPVLISGSRHTPPQPYLIEKLMEEFMLHFKELETQGEHPIHVAAYLHDELVRIHPFIDGNGRTARLLMNLYLLGKGYVIISLKGDVESRIAYYKALEASHVKGDTEAFKELVAQAEVDALEKYLKIIEGDKWLTTTPY